MNLRTKVPELH